MNNYEMNDINDEEEDTQKNKFLTFSLGKEYYGVEINYVTEIVGMQDITEVPELPTAIRGVINLRDNIIPVMDARIKFKKEMMPYNDRTCIIVIDVSSLMLGIIVDAVSEVVTIEESQIVPPPLIITKATKFIKNIGKNDNRVTLLLNCEKLLNQEEIDSIKNGEV